MERWKEGWVAMVGGCADRWIRERVDGWVSTWMEAWMDESSVLERPKDLHLLLSHRIRCK